MKHMKKSKMKAMLFGMALVGILAVFGRVEAAEGDFVIENGVLKTYNGNDKHVVIPDGVKVIGKNAFMGNKTIESVDIPKGVEEIGYYAFGDSNLKKVSIPEGVTKMGKWAFLGCEIKSVTLPKSLKKIPPNAFEATSLKKIVISKGCTEIGARAFWCCTDLKKVTISEGVKKIGEGAFKDTAIKKITIPKSVKTLGNKYGVFTYAETPQSIREITILNPKLKVKNMFGTSALDKSLMKRYEKEGLVGVRFLKKTVTIKGYKNSTAEKFVKNIKKNKKKYIQSVKFVALK